MRSFRSSPEFDGFSKVTIIVSDEIEYSAGTDSGRTLRLNNPWGTPEMAKNILETVRGFQYQPYTAEGAFLDPAVELGDGITANNVYGGVYTQRLKFGSKLTATVAAPEDEEINHEYPYKSKPNKEITREAKMLRASLAIEADRITTEVRNRENAISEVYSAITIQANRITQEVTDRTKADSSLSATIDVQAKKIETKVSKTGGNASSFGWTLTDSDWTIKGNGRDILKATRAGLEVYGKITATTGSIGGFDILSNYLSYNNQTWGGTNTTGIYLGISGIQMGRDFKVDSTGNLTARSGTFNGTIYAENISYGDYSGGYLNGGAIAGGSLYGDRLVANTITTDYTDTGINGSLGRADAAYNVVNGYSKFSTLIGSTLSADDIKLGSDSRTLGTTQITYKDGNNMTKTLNVVTWS